MIIKTKYIITIVIIVVTAKIIIYLFHLLLVIVKSTDLQYYFYHTNEGQYKVNSQYRQSINYVRSKSQKSERDQKWGVG